MKLNINSADKLCFFNWTLFEFRHYKYTQLLYGEDGQLNTSCERQGYLHPLRLNIYHLYRKCIEYYQHLIIAHKVNAVYLRAFIVLWSVLMWSLLCYCSESLCYYLDRICVSYRFHMCKFKALFIITAFLSHIPLCIY